MQEALDDNLTPELQRELYQALDESPVESAEYARLRHVDRLLKSAPLETAPEGLALRVLARLTKGLQSQKLMRPSSLALALGLALVVLGLLPLLGIIGALMINAVGSASALKGVLDNVVDVLAVIAQLLDSVIDSAQALLRSYPEAPIAMFTLIPAALFMLWRIGREEMTRS
jgi:anti-sigma factor RsiW